MKASHHILWSLWILILLSSSCDKNEKVSEVTTPPQTPLSETEQACISNGWSRMLFNIDNRERKIMWKAPIGAWSEGVVLVLHGGGGKACDFCTGGSLVQPQIDFANLAIQNGLAVMALDSTNNIVTDSTGLPCGKRFDFSVLNRSNIDLPYIEHILTNIIPSLRPSGSSQNIFITGLSTGGFMTIRAATHFDGLITAFAPIAAGDPYGTDPICDSNLSPRDSAVGILVDRETSLEIVTDNACFNSGSYPNESPWESQSPTTKPDFKQFHHQKDGIVDYSCAGKAYDNIILNGYNNSGPFILNQFGDKNVLYHLWLNAYNQPLVDFFLSQ